MAFERLVRFQHEGNAFYGNLIKAEENKYVVQKLIGTVENGFKAGSGKQLTVSEVCPGPNLTLKQWHSRTSAEPCRSYSVPLKTVP